MFKDLTADLSTLGSPVLPRWYITALNTITEDTNTRTTTADKDGVVILNAADYRTKTLTNLLQ